MSRRRVFVTRIIPENGLELLRAQCEVDLWEDALPPPRDELLRHAAPCSGLLTMLSDPIDGDLMAACPDLRVVSNYAVGTDNIDRETARERGIAVGNTPGVLTDATADLAVTLLLAAARCVPSAGHNATSGAWKTWEPCGHIGRDLVGQTLGIVGMGRIGYAVARRLARGFDMQVLYHARRDHEEAERVLGARRVSFGELLEQSDFVSVHTPLTAETSGMFDAAAFQRMRPGAVFVNTARGGVVVQSDLVQALREGSIFAAGLDVTDPEPPAADDPLLHLPNVVLLPHIGSATVGTRGRMAEIAAENVLAGLGGRPLPYAVT